MIRVSCPDCGRKFMWDDFQADNVRCPGCGRKINVHRSLRENIETRDAVEKEGVVVCPHCGGELEKRWFCRCPHCRRLLFGGFSISDNVVFISAVIMAYLAFSLYYFLVIR